jgi:hypothetical protein
MLPHVVVQFAATLDVNCCDPPSAKVGLNGLIVSAVAAPVVSTALAE